MPERWNAPLYLLLFIVSSVGLSWWAVLDADGSFEVMQALAASVVVSAAITIVFREVVEMLAEQFKKMRYERGLEEGRTQVLHDILKTLDEMKGRGEINEDTANQMLLLLHRSFPSQSRDL